MRRASSRTTSEPSRWAVLALLGVAQLMVVLDATIVNVALPSAQHGLHFSATNRQWVITAYALAFGSLLLMGGKLGDLFGRKWTLIGGLFGFSVASVIGGLAQSFGMLVAARALQGTFAALLAPSALGLLTETFQGSADRAKAFGIFTAISGGGASLGLLLGGVLTQAISWRWSLYVNLVIALPTAAVAMRLLGNQRQSERARIDFPGVALSSAGLFALVYGFSNAETSSWSDPLTIFALAASIVLLGGFLILERRVQHPLLPLHIVWDRARGGAFASIAISGSAIFAVFLFLTFYMQQNLGFSPLKTGLGFLPMTAVIVITATTVQTQVLHRTGAKPLVVSGMSLGVIAMLLLSRLTAHGAYVSHVLPGLMLSGLAIALVFAPAFSTATLGVRSADAGIASAIVNTSQQVGSSVGTAFLSTMFAAATATASYSSPHAHAHGLADAASIHGYSTAFEWAAALLAVGLLLALLILPRDGLARAASAQTQASTEPALKAADLTPSQIHTYRAAALTASCTHAHRPVPPRRLLMANKLRRTTFRTGELITESAVHDVLGPQIETTEAPDAKTQRAPKAEDLPPQTHPPLSRLKPLHHRSVAELLPEPINPPPAGPVIR